MKPSINDRSISNTLKGESEESFYSVREKNQLHYREMFSFAKIFTA